MTTGALTPDQRQQLERILKGARALKKPAARVIAKRKAGK